MSMQEFLLQHKIRIHSLEATEPKFLKALVSRDRIFHSNTEGIPFNTSRITKMLAAKGKGDGKEG